MRYLNLLTISSLFLSGACAHSYRQRLDAELSKWTGKHPDELVATWGAPRSTYTMENGRKVLTFEDSAFVSRSLGSFYYVRPEVYSYSDTCKLSFFTDVQQKQVESYSYTGSVGVCLELIESVSRTVRQGP